MQRIPFKSAPIFSLACLKIHLNSIPSQILIMLLLNSGRTDVTGLSLTKISPSDLLTMFTYCINKNMFVHVLAPKQQQKKRNLLSICLLTIDTQNYFLGYGNEISVWLNVLTRPYSSVEISQHTSLDGSTSFT